MHTQIGLFWFFVIIWEFGVGPEKTNVVGRRR